jgi:hypothetical protein
LLWSYWRNALRERGLELFAVAAGDLATAAELIEPFARTLPEPCSRVFLGEIVFLERAEIRDMASAAVLIVCACFRPGQPCSLRRVLFSSE